LTNVSDRASPSYKLRPYLTILNSANPNSNGLVISQATNGNSVIDNGWGGSLDFMASNYIRWYGSKAANGTATNGMAFYTSGTNFVIQMGQYGGTNVSGTIQTRYLTVNANTSAYDTFPVSFQSVDANQRTLYVGGNATFNSSMGIGTTNPATTLDVNGTTTLRGTTSITTGSFGIGTTSPATTLDVNGATTLRGSTFITTGSFGIGTTSPATTLDVNGATSLRGATTITTGSLVLSSTGDQSIIATSFTGKAELKLINSTGCNNALGIDNDGCYIYSQGFVSGSTFAGPKLIVSHGNGYVGINTTNPVTTLDVNGTVSLRSNTSISGNLSVTGSFTPSGNVSIGSNLSVTGTSTLTGLVSIPTNGGITLANGSYVRYNQGNGSLIESYWGGYGTNDRYGLYLPPSSQIVKLATTNGNAAQVCLSAITAASSSAASATLTFTDMLVASAQYGHVGIGTLSSYPLHITTPQNNDSGQPVALAIAHKSVNSTGASPLYLAQYPDGSASITNYGTGSTLTIQTTQNGVLNLNGKNMNISIDNGLNVTDSINTAYGSMLTLQRNNGNSAFIYYKNSITGYYAGPDQNGQFYIGNDGSFSGTYRRVRIADDLNVAGSISGNSKSFEINHPTKSNYRLVHASIEGPRFDLMYRGTTILSDGRAIVDVCKSCNTTGGMTSGTLLALGQNFDVFLQNKTGFTPVRYELAGEILTITAQDANCTDTISWMVVCERADKSIVNESRTDSKGCLRTEIPISV
jgi:hypothetical protein